VSEIFRQRGLKNVRYQFASTEDEYAGFMAGDKVGFDLIVVDGSWRSTCIARAADMLRPGGILYLDNSDKDSEPHGGDMRLAEERAREFATRRGGTITLFTDFAPTQLFVQQGLLVQTPGQR
jgi:predicted O-methyltransferase YrrM